ncbi:reaction center protein H chain [Candidatus Phycosocius bacilliformis]|uniref:Reaction center protein H chain n=1 Tax=Candidatus Phycosocius bacilliformis TaxID=1445552 RepID=A0A2P2E736_9PROT|nr:photosynthetic reaction center subunit H [Candidatus Phycosocius bacilliformis]GBF56859.1 reaction center protein H chain [Candidatus Phycosocius bacilliformis]
MYNHYFAGTVDVTEIVLYVFFGFFLMLVLYLLREGRREGFPLEHDVTGELEPTPGVFFRALPKTYLLPGGGKLVKPDDSRDTHATQFKRTAAWSGSPIEPDGNPLTSGIGPGSYAMRADKPDMTNHGTTRLAPLRIATDYYTDKRDPELRGFALVGLDGAHAGTITDIWVDRAEFLIRYLEVDVTAEGGPTKHVLVPMTMCVVQKGLKRVRLDAVLGSQVAGAPTLANPDQITLLEEEKIVGYFGAGYLYATPARSEPAI